jgi:hypothetical protein
MVAFPQNDDSMMRGIEDDACGKIKRRSHRGPPNPGIAGALMKNGAIDGRIVLAMD